MVYKDCYADAPESTREICDDPSNIACSKCKGNLCNNEVKRRGTKCFKCEGLECMTPVFPDIVECLSDCYVGLNTKGETLRGCSNEISNANLCGNSDENCFTCADDHCNGIIFPTNNRLLCVKCFGDDCIQENTTNEYCEKVHADERCVTVFDGSTAVIERGCSSTVQNSVTCGLEDSYLCLKCNFSSCNIATSTLQKYFCVSCSSEDHNCVTSPNATQVAVCSTDSCYSRLLENDGTGQQIERGCVEKITQCTSYNSCQSCSGERCNSEIFPSNRHSCYSCFGDHCAIGHLHEKLCSTYNDQNKECVTLYGEGKLIQAQRIR